MRGFCTKCKENRGKGEKWGILNWRSFPVCEKCGSYVDITEGDDDR